MKIDNMAKSNRQPVVLIVDDEQLCLDVEVKMLQRLEYTVLAARDGKEAVKIYEMNQEVVDLIILDMNMLYRGELTFGKLKMVDNKVKVLLTSGWYQDYRVKKLLDRGCKGFIQKPFNLDVFSQNIKKALNN
jgi:DNA-binding NtrC family response regulator